MSFLKIMFLINILFLNAQEANNSPLSFKIWKNQKITEATQTLDKMQSQQKSSPYQFGPEEEAKLRQAAKNLEIAKDLTPQDYFVLYLSSEFSGDTEIYSKAVKLMEPEEVAEILMAYDKLIEERRKKSVIQKPQVSSIRLPVRLNPESIFLSTSP